MGYVKSIDEFFARQKDWIEALEELRELFLLSDMGETLKWGAPTYTVNGKNVAGIGAFKSYVGIWFFQGVFLNDAHKKLMNAQEGVTKAMRQWRFFSAEDVRNNRALILAYLEEAIENHKLGKELKPQAKKDIPMPKELQQHLSENNDFLKAFESLTPGKRREYTEYIAEAKRTETKESRIAKIIPLILNGNGLHDKYK